MGTITYDEDNDNMTCSCGNTTHTDGFVAVDENNLECEPDEYWDGTYMCQTCGAKYKTQPRGDAVMLKGMGPQIDTTRQDGWRMFKSILIGLGALAGCGALNVFLN